MRIFADGYEYKSEKIKIRNSLIRQSDGSYKTVLDTELENEERDIWFNCNMLLAANDDVYKKLEEEGILKRIMEISVGGDKE